VIIDASVVIDAVADPGPRGAAARAALAAVPPAERLIAPGHFAFEILSGLRAAAGRPGHPLTPEEVAPALADAEELGIAIEGATWPDVRRAWGLAQGSVRYADAIYLAAAERHRMVLLTADAGLARSGARVECEIIVVDAS